MMGYSPKRVICEKEEKEELRKRRKSTRD